MEAFREEEIAGLVPAPAKTEVTYCFQEGFDVVRASAFLTRGTLGLCQALVIGSYLYMSSRQCDLSHPFQRNPLGFHGLVFGCI